MWFVDKLGPTPRAAAPLPNGAAKAAPPQTANARPAPSAQQPPAGAHMAPPRSASTPMRAPEPEPSKKKKGWF